LEPRVVADLSLDDFEVEETVPVTLERAAPLADMYVLSPYVWREQEREQGQTSSEEGALPHSR